MKLKNSVYVLRMQHTNFHYLISVTELESRTITYASCNMSKDCMRKFCDVIPTSSSLLHYIIQFEHFQLFLIQIICHLSEVIGYCPPNC